MFHNCCTAIFLGINKASWILNLVGSEQYHAMAFWPSSRKPSRPPFRQTPWYKSRLSARFPPVTSAALTLTPEQTPGVQVPSCSSLIGRPRLHIPPHCVLLMSITVMEPSPEIWNRACGSPAPALFAQTASAPLWHWVRLCGCACAQAGEKWPEPRGPGQTNMELPKTLISVLWILFLNTVKDCHGEEGTWKPTLCQTGVHGSGARVRAGESLAAAPVRGWDSKSCCAATRRVLTR